MAIEGGDEPIIRVDLRQPQTARDPASPGPSSLRRRPRPLPLQIRRRIRRRRLLTTPGPVPAPASPSSSFELPVLYFSLLSLGVAVSPSTAPEISRQVRLVKPAVAFAVILLDSPEFAAMTRDGGNSLPVADVPQSLPAAVLYSSGITGRVKGVELTHRNLIAMLTVYGGIKGAVTSPAVHLVTVPLFHAYGFGVWLCAVAKGDTLVLMSRFDMGKALSAVERFKVTQFPAAPPVVSALARDSTVELYDLTSLELVTSSGAPLPTDAMRRFVSRFPHVLLSQGLGMTENPLAICMAVEPEECQRLGPVGRLSSNHEAKIVDPDSGEALPPGRRGELWIRSPAVMKGYIGDQAATAKALGKDGWLRTGDLCYFDDEGFLFVVDRLKELIKYKGYQVAPAELEDLLLTHREIVDAAVIQYFNFFLFPSLQLPTSPPDLSLALSLSLSLSKIIANNS
ncbi:hypothetical protein H6P81_013335 [Aristolochia fimbriata]|uniref:AMP-dependent synthetase/ligase domain-containing protein n=1 Tax=Aristolochia fimbriata TaxID=158543 RepID=A0AAV7EI21_ARIFI|nr:hypothetical protein H6P81_013335 [Aristolochia fimbriata]